MSKGSGSGVLLCGERRQDAALSKAMIDGGCLWPGADTDTQAICSHCWGWYCGADLMTCGVKW
jgi:hypothetical protein